MVQWHLQMALHCSFHLTGSTSTSSKENSFRVFEQRSKAKYLYDTKCNLFERPNIENLYQKQTANTCLDSQVTSCCLIWGLFTNMLPLYLYRLNEPCCAQHFSWYSKWAQTVCIMSIKFETVIKQNTWWNHTWRKATMSLLSSKCFV